MASRGMGRILRDECRAGTTTRCFSEDRRERTGAGMALILPDAGAPVKRGAPGARAPTVRWRAPARAGRGPLVAGVAARPRHELALPRPIERPPPVARYGKQGRAGRHRSGDPAATAE